ncbi:MAG: hypothetical protein WAU31_02250 [Candidatus Moraniibacteriota bacterium]
MKKRLFFIFSFLSLIFGSIALTSYRNVLHAEDDDEEYEKDDHESDNTKKVSTDNSSPTKQSTVTNQPTLIPVTTITQQEVTTVLTDSDGDGLYDNEDPHPNIPEIYIVHDDNKNGIADRFESSP